MRFFLHGVLRVRQTCSKETYNRDLQNLTNKKRPIKETYKRDLDQWNTFRQTSLHALFLTRSPLHFERHPAFRARQTCSKETYKRDLQNLTNKKRPIKKTYKRDLDQRNTFRQTFRHALFLRRCPLHFEKHPAFRARQTRSKETYKRDLQIETHKKRPLKESLHFDIRYRRLFLCISKCKTPSPPNMSKRDLQKRPTKRDQPVKENLHFDTRHRRLFLCILKCKTPCISEMQGVTNLCI